MSHKIALIGAGAMGCAIGARLGQMGQDLTVYDLDAKKVAALVRLGATSASSAAMAAAQADFVEISLNAAPIVEQAVFGPQVVAEGAKTGSLLIDMSSIDPDATKALAAKAAALGLRRVDNPLSGGAPKVALGQLTLMMGGAAQDVAEAQQHIDTANRHRFGRRRSSCADGIFHRTK